MISLIPVLTGEELVTCVLTGEKEGPCEQYVFQHSS